MGMVNDKVQYLQEFAVNEKPEAVKDRIAQFVELLADSGYNATRTTRAALLNIATTYGDGKDFDSVEDEPLDELTPAEQFAIDAPHKVDPRVAEFKALVVKSGRNFTRTTCAALVKLGNEMYPVQS